MKPILIGLDNPRSRDPAMALWPLPAGCSGWRLWKMLSERTGCTRRQYADAFDRRNLSDLAGPLSAGSTAVLLGEEVRRSLKVPRMLIHALVRDGVTYRQVPHPSGRCHFYNDPVQRALVALMLEELYLGSRHAG